jgi:membrane protease YdiL (CAAX protease family)
MTVDPQQPPPAPEFSPPSAVPVEAAFPSHLPSEPPPFVPLPPPLPELAPPPPRRPWRFWATLGWGLLVLLGWGLTQAIVVIVIMVASGMLAQVAGPPLSPGKMDALKIRLISLTFCPATVISCPVGIALIWLFVWIRRWPLRKYLGLGRPRVKPLLISLVAMLAVLMGMEYCSRFAGVDPGDQVMTQIMLQAPSAVLVCIALVIAAPLFEELCFRGFLFQGFAASIGPIAAILLTSAIFAALHIQYNLFGILMVFIAGLTLGCTRWFTGSTTITILQHALMNGIAAVQAFYFQN